MNILKSITISAFTVFLLSAFKSDNKNTLPAVDVKKIDGTIINTSTFTNDGKPMIISFWATWCKPCKKELDVISKNYIDMQKETGVKLMAICIDDSRSSLRAITEAKTKAWPFEVYLDENKNLMNALNITNVPYTLIIDGKGNIVWSHDSYADGDENELFNQIRELIKQ